MSKRFGFVLFDDTAARNAALKAGTLRMRRDRGKSGGGHTKVKVCAVERADNELGRGRDVGLCRQWAKGVCARGEGCRFLHEGAGACAPPPS